MHGVRIYMKNEFYLWANALSDYKEQSEFKIHLAEIVPFCRSIDML